MKYLKTAFCIALLLVFTNAYANQNNFCQSPDSLSTDEYPVYGDVLKDAYFFPDGNITEQTPFRN